MILTRYARWLHTAWPTGAVERLPTVGDDGETSVSGVRIAGDLTGIPLLKLAIDSAVRAVRAFARELAEIDSRPARDPAVLDLVIVGGGVAGIAAAIEARALGLRFEVIEGARAFDTVHGFPARKPIFTYPTELEPEGSLKVVSDVKEALTEELESQRAAHGIVPRIGRVDRITHEGDTHSVHLEGDATPLRARRVLVAIGRSGDHRALGVPGEELDHVRHRLFDPADHRGQRVVVVGGGDSACESAIALATHGAFVTMVHRGEDLSRAKHENAEAVSRLARDEKTLELVLRTSLCSIDTERVHLETDGVSRAIECDAVFTMIGRDPPLGFLRRSGIRIARDWNASKLVALLAFLALCTFVYTWKSGGVVTTAFRERGWFPFGVGESLFAPIAGSISATIAITLEEPGFWYSLAYTAAIVGFGIARIRRRRTPYVTKQTLTLTAIQIVPLFLLPYFVLPVLGNVGVFDEGVGRAIADALFPAVDYGHGREYWRAFGFILAWPLFLWNVFSDQPLWTWLVISLVQTFVVVPLIVRRWGKGGYCGWICSCGALAETMGDAHREKMPHGPFWKKLELLGQGILGAAFVLLLARLTSWLLPHWWVGRSVGRFFRTAFSRFEVLGIPLDYYHLVDIFFAGILGVGLYFWFSGRTWCRFACPLAALMNIYQRAFGLFRIFAEKKKCISCNRCTTVCHQGIDVMAFAQRGAPMEDPQCVRCSACVQSCPTGVLSFGRVGANGEAILDVTPASPVRMREDGKRGLRVVAA